MAKAWARAVLLGGALLTLVMGPAGCASGTPPGGRDGGVDARGGDLDAGSPGIDAFVPGTDAFVPPGTDAFVPPGADAFVPGADAFVPAIDGGPITGMRRYMDRCVADAKVRFKEK